jgi:hypothetical protein
MGVRRVRGALGVGALFALFALGCVDDREPLTNIPGGCDDGAQCVGPTGGKGSSGGSGSTGGTGANGITGSVLRLADDGFLQTSPFLGPATIRALKTGGGFTEAAYADGAFKLNDVALGEGVLFQILDAVPGSPEIVSTYNYRDVLDATKSVTLVAVNEEVLSSLALCLNITLDPASAHAILRLVKNDFPIEGAIVTDDGSVGIVAYQDLDPAAPCAYTFGGAATGSNGVALLFNIPVPANGRLSLEVSDGVNPFAGFLDLANGTITYTDLAL